MSPRNEITSQQEEEEDEDCTSLFERYHDVLNNPTSGLTKYYRLKKAYEFIYTKKGPVFSKGIHYLRKPLFFYSCGRPSQIWEAPPKNMPDASGRVQQLANAKGAHPEYKEDRDVLGPEEIFKLFPKSQFFYSCGRNSPIWHVTKGAKSAEDRPRTNQLAAHKNPVKDFQPARQIETIIPGPALSASASERLQALAAPKNRSEGPFRHPQWPVTPAAKNASAKARSVELARPKGTTDGYMLPKDEIWPISRAAKRASASGRVSELAKPVVRASMDHVQFNPDAFLVKETALKGVIPKRVFDLANPLSR